MNTVPSKFEGCPDWARDEYENYLNGFADIKWVNDTLISYSETQTGQLRAIWEDDNGFVHCREFADAQSFNRWLADIDPLEIS